MKKKMGIVGILILSLCIQLVSVATLGKAAEDTISITEFYNNGTRGEEYKQALAGAVVTISSVEELRMFFACLKDEEWTKGISFRQEADICFSNYKYTYDSEKKVTRIWEGDTLLGITSQKGGFYLDDSSIREVEFAWIGDKNAYILGDMDVFAGEYDGQGHLISGFVLDGYDQMYNGIFGHITESGMISNVHIKNALLYDSSGALAGLSLGIIKDCLVESVIGYGDYLGGIAESSQGKILRCRVADSVLALNDRSDWSWAIKIGGITGSAYEGKVDDCVVENVKIYLGKAEKIYAGGIAGYVSGAEVTNSSSLAECISLEEDNGSIIGGIVGKVEAFASPQIRNCVSAGKVHGDIVGGILGSSGLLEGSAMPDVENCVSYSQVSGRIAGGIVGKAFVGNLYYNYCYDAGSEKMIAVQDEECSIEKCCKVTEGQIFGTESAKSIGGGIQNSNSLLVVLNNWVGMDSQYLEWKKGELGYPVLTSRISEPFVGAYDFRQEADGGSTNTKDENSNNSEDSKTDTDSENGNNSEDNKTDTDSENGNNSEDNKTDKDDKNDNNSENDKTGVQNVVAKGQLELKNAKIKVTDKLKVKLTWDKNEYAKGYQIFRSTKSNRGYKKIGTVSLSKDFYVDKKAQAGKTYYYKVCAYATNNDSLIYGKSQKKKIKLPWYQAPVIQLSKGKMSGQTYVQLAIKKYSGTHIEVYFSGDGKAYYKALLEQKKISEYKGKLKFSYTKKSTLYCKVRTYQIKNGKKQYSLFTKEKKIQL